MDESSIRLQSKYIWLGQHRSDYLQTGRIVMSHAADQMRPAAVAGNPGTRQRHRGIGRFR